ncbi:MAG: hypothetical protein ABIQ74_04270, partial [Chitinophagales bacterium]
MKKASLFLIIHLLAKTSFAQITLEHTFDSAGYFFNPTIYQQLYVVNLEVDSQKFVFVDRKDKVLRLYNLDYSIWKTISFVAATDVNPLVDAMGILYISQHLFNTDDQIEFLYADQNQTISAVTQIINEDGSISFTANNQIPAVFLNVPQVQRPIYNTTAGTKMILSGVNNDGNAYVYGLPGVLETGMLITNTTLNSMNLSVPYPNPTSDETRIDFQLPRGIEKGQIIFYDIMGNEVKRFVVDRTFDYLK